ncbi:hypothetical protein B9G54_00480 [Alloscardovia macacae]|uniref:DUF4127 domain-containing protein n=1 Tax=Alloscardovia macacae TaxID=1160091 RepID=A0A1Y2SWH5_9BIFI|nr:DUF4127 family protein [Alloscardovia macacae]OTA27585.1 hypothetical protein B9G54_00480 [Alloscardovia macacae]OTA30231.1 hypothetical protein B9T39_00560 [Alloscardovia macacae]
MKVLLVPLDERPCNAKFPLLVAESSEDIELLEPPQELFGYKKSPADVQNLSEWVIANACEADAMVIALDSLVYGGLIPSRIHYDDIDTLEARLNVVKDVRRKNPRIKIYAFSTVMRAPTYNSSEEEPDYYAQYGADLFLRRTLMDKKDRGLLLEGDLDQLDSIVIPSTVIRDYETRREINLTLNQLVLKLVKSGDIDYVVFPQDDSSPFGYTAQAQRKLAQAIASSGVRSHVGIYPGSDEVGLTLLSHAVCALRNEKPSISVHYVSTLGPGIVPRYEDRPMYESLKAHIRAAGARIADSSEKADIELMINSPGKTMQEAQYSLVKRDLTYDTYRNLSEFVNTIVDYADQGRKIAVCDSAYSNGGDPQLIAMMDECGIISSISSYAGWNTNCNTLGNTLSQAILAQDTNANVQRNLAYRLIEDVFYQTFVRWQLDEEILDHGGSYTNVSSCLDWARSCGREKLQSMYDALSFAVGMPMSIDSVDFPWERLFEINIDIHHV